MSTAYQQIIQQLEQDRNRLRDMINGDINDTVQLETRIEKSIKGQIAEFVAAQGLGGVDEENVWTQTNTFNDPVYFNDTVTVNGNEVSQILIDLFNAQTGSSIIRTSTGYAWLKDNLLATTDPTVNDDQTQGYSPRSRWFNLSTNESFMCLGHDVGAAVWQKTSLTLDELGSAALSDVNDFQTNIGLDSADAQWVNDAQTVIVFPGGGGVNITATQFYGGGSSLQDLDAANITQGILSNDRLNSASTSQKGIVQLVNSANNPSTSLAPTANAVKIVWDGLATKASLTSDQTFTGFNLFSRAISDDEYTRFVLPNGGKFTTGINSLTGAIRIRLPETMHNSNTMMRFKVEIFNYFTGTSTSFVVSGYNYFLGWENVTVDQIGGDNIPPKNVRFGDDGTRDVIWIGETGDSWLYPQVFITEVMIGYTGFNGNWAEGWDIDFVTSFDTVEINKTSNVLLNQYNVLNYTASGSHTHSDATTLASGFMSAADKQKLDTIQSNAEQNVGTHLGVFYDATFVTIASSTGSNVDVNTATQTLAGFMSAADKQKLDTIQSGGQVNSVNTVFGRTGNVEAQSGDYTFAQIGSKPTTLAGYGITDAASAGHGHSDATTLASGFMSASDKQKLDNLQQTYSWNIQTGNFTASQGVYYGLDTTSNPLTVTLPSSPTNNNRIFFMIISNNVEVNNITFLRNGQTIEGLAEDMTVSDSYPRYFGLEFINNDWKVFA